MNLVGITLLNRYFLRELVGSGGMADVYLAWDKLRSTKMAIKVLRSDLAGNSRFFRNFTKEAEVLRKLEHPNIVRLYEFERDGEIVFLVMDWVEGTNLKKALELRGNQPFSLEEVSRILPSIVGALHYAHQIGVYHCDVKPANILLHNDGRVLLTDFGVAQVVNEQGGGGTPPYMAPEQFLGLPVNSQTDIYALGVTIFELLSGGKLPFTGKSPEAKGTTTKEKIGWEHLNLAVPSLRLLNPKIPENVEKVISTALQKNSSLRFTSMVEFREAFEKACHPVETNNLGNQTLPPLSQKSDTKSTQNKLYLPTTSSTNAGEVKRLPSSENISGESINNNLIKILGNKNSTTNKEHSVGLKAAVPAKGMFLVAHHGDFSGQILPVPLGELSLGRGEQNTIRFVNRSVSRRHATVIRTRKGVYIRDNGSTLGTFINGKRIPQNTLVQLNNGDTIQLGISEVFVFQVK